MIAGDDLWGKLGIKGLAESNLVCLQFALRRRLSIFQREGLIPRFSCNQMRPFHQLSLFTMASRRLWGPRLLAPFSKIQAPSPILCFTEILIWTSIAGGSRRRSHGLLHNFAPPFVFRLSDWKKNLSNPHTFSRVLFWYLDRLHKALPRSKCRVDTGVPDVY